MRFGDLKIGTQVSGSKFGGMYVPHRRSHSDDPRREETAGRV
jgi:hypothetical protein